MIKYTEEVQKQRKDRLADLRQTISRLKRIESLNESQEWQDFKNILYKMKQVEEFMEKKAIQAIETGRRYDGVLKEHVAVTSEQACSDIRVAKKGQYDFQFMIDLVEKTKQQIYHVQQTIDRVETEFKDAKEQLED